MTASRVLAAGQAAGRPRSRHRAGLVAGLAALVGVLAVVCFFSVTMGSRSITLATIWRAFAGFDPTSAAETVVWQMRLPRTLLGIAVGAALGAGGAVLQGVTRNPLADPGIMGINAGAAACIVVAIMVLGARTPGVYVWFAFLGAGLATVAVYAIASFGREGATPVKLALAGAAVTAGLSSVTAAVVLTHVEALNELRFWQVGSLAGRYLPVLRQTAPFMALGLVVALGAGRALNGLALGEDVARALGQRVRRTRAVLFVAVAVLCGAATAACGPISFLGLVAPQVARLFCGPDYRWVLAYSVVLAPVVLLLADIAGRVVMAPDELQVGVVLGVIGAPAFVALVRYRKLTEL